jgi:hypothetical protein
VAALANVALELLNLTPKWSDFASAHFADPLRQYDEIGSRRCFSEHTSIDGQVVIGKEAAFES